MSWVLLLRLCIWIVYWVDIDLAKISCFPFSLRTILSNYPLSYSHSNPLPSTTTSSKPPPSQTDKPNITLPLHSLPFPLAPTGPNRLPPSKRHTRDTHASTQDPQQPLPSAFSPAPPPVHLRNKSRVHSATCATNVTPGRPAAQPPPPMRHPEAVRWGPRDEN